MRPHPLARRYAKALFELALERQILEQVSDEVKSFGRILETESRVRAYLLSPEIDKRQKREFLQRLFSEKISNLFYHFLLLLVNKGRQRYFAEIVFEFARIYDLKHNRMRATVTSAIALEEREVEEIRGLLSRLMQAEIVINSKVDAGILGGVIIQIGGKVIDGSLIHQLELMRRQMRSAKT